MSAASRLRWGGLVWVWMSALVVAGCSSTPAPKGVVPTAPSTTAELGQSDVNRMATLGMRANLDSLLARFSAE